MASPSPKRDSIRAPEKKELAAANSELTTEKKGPARATLEAGESKREAAAQKELTREKGLPLETKRAGEENQVRADTKGLAVETKAPIREHKAEGVREPLAEAPSDETPPESTTSASAELSEPPSLDPRSLLDALAPAGAGDAGTLRPSELDQRSEPPKAATRKVSRWAVPIAAVLGVAVIAVVAIGQRSSDPQTSAEVKVAPPPAAAQKTVTEAPRKEQEAIAVEQPPEPTPAPVPALSASAEVVDKPPEPKLADAFAAALSATPTSVQVMVRITPEGAAIFDQGKRLGTDTVTVNVEPGSKVMLSALLNGYQPKRFAIDGTEDSVTIALQPIDAKLQQAAPPEQAAGSIAPAPAAAGGAAAMPPKPVKSAPAEPFDPTRDVGSL